MEEYIKTWFLKQVAQNGKKIKREKKTRKKRQRERNRRQFDNNSFWNTAGNTQNLFPVSDSNSFVFFFFLNYFFPIPFPFFQFQITQLFFYVILRHTACTN